MAELSEIIQDIHDNIHTNGQNQITGQLLQTTLDGMAVGLSEQVSQLGQEVAAKPNYKIVLSSQFSIAGLVKEDGSILDAPTTLFRRTEPIRVAPLNSISVFAFANSVNASILSVFADAQCTEPIALSIGDASMELPRYYSYFNDSDNSVYVILTTKSPFVNDSFGLYGPDLYVGGITEKIKNIQNEVVTISNVTKEITIHGVVVASGNTILAPTSPYRLTDFIPVTPNQIIKFKTAVSINAFGVSAYSSNTPESIIVDSPVSILGSYSSSTLEDYFIIIPDGVNYIRICRDSNIVSDTLITLAYYVSGLTKDVILLQKDFEEIKGDVNYLQTIASNIHYSIISSPQTQPRKGFVCWCMDCGANFFYDESKTYDEKLVATGYKNTTYAVLPGDLSDEEKRNFVKYFYDLGREMVIHSDNRINSATTEALYEQLVQTYFKEMNDGGIVPAGGWISLGGNTVLYLTMLKKYIGWGQTGPKNYNIQNDQEYLLAVNTIQTDPAHLMRIFIEQTPEEVTTEITNTIIQRSCELIDYAANNGSYIIFYTHSYNRPTAVYTLYDAVFEPILAYIKQKQEKGLINIGAIGEMVNYYYAKRYNE